MLYFLFSLLQNYIEFYHEANAYIELYCISLLLSYGVCNFVYLS